MTIQRIESGTPKRDTRAFFESRFSHWLELRDKHKLYLHFILSGYKNKGNTRDLIWQWLMKGYEVDVVKPRPIMQHILTKFNFTRSTELIQDP
jgi:hypothetical protein